MGNATFDLFTIYMQVTLHLTQFGPAKIVPGNFIPLSGFKQCQRHIGFVVLSKTLHALKYFLWFLYLKMVHRTKIHWPQVFCIFLSFSFSLYICNRVQVIFNHLNCISFASYELFYSCLSEKKEKVWNTSRAARCPKITLKHREFLWMLIIRYLGTTT